MSPYHTSRDVLWRTEESSENGESEGSGERVVTGEAVGTAVIGVIVMPEKTVGRLK